MVIEVLNESKSHVTVKWKIFYPERSRKPMKKLEYMGETTQSKVDTCNPQATPQEVSFPFEPPLLRLLVPSSSPNISSPLSNHKIRITHKITQPINFANKSQNWNTKSSHLELIQNKTCSPRTMWKRVTGRCTR